jgi:putative membrane protein
MNAVLNGTSAVLLLSAFVAIRAGEKERHKRLMLAAFGVSSVFLVSYLARFYMSGTTAFTGTGLVKGLYLSILFSHMALAATVPVGAILAIRFGLRGNNASHRRVVRVIFPAWVYVSVTGVVIYVMLYHVPGR